MKKTQFTKYEKNKIQGLVFVTDEAHDGGVLPEIFLVERDGESLVFKSPLLYVTASGIWRRNRFHFDLAYHCSFTAPSWCACG